MKEYMLIYIDQVNEINRLMLQSEYIDREKDVIQFIQERSEKVYVLMQSNNEIIKANIMPYLNADYELSEVEYKELNEFANQLCTISQYIDVGLAYLIHQKLLETAEKNGVLDQIIEQQYDIGIACYILFSEYEMFDTIDVRQKVVPWFNKIAQHLDEFEELSHASRGYVLRSLNNEALIFNAKRYNQLDAYMKTIRHTLEVFTSEKIQKLEPDINWNAFVRAVYRNCLRISDCIEHGHGLQYIPDVTQAANWLNQTRSHNDEISEIDQYSAIELANILHQISDEECLEQLNAIYQKHDASRYDRKGIDQNINIPSFSLLYEIRITKRNIDRVNRKINEIIQYVTAFHRHTGLYSYHYAISNFIRYYPDEKDIVPFRYVLENLLIALHVPTYVHSQMVSKISVMIGKFLLQERPESFLECGEQKSLEEIEANQKELLEFIRYAGIFHDIGKFYCMDVVTQYSRRLFDNEFDVIRLHAECGYKILSWHKSTNAYAEVALMHHISYDRRSGYAKEFMPSQEKVGILSDIVRIADAIDAATDTIGRCYAAGKTQEAIMQELVDSPSNYNPLIVEVMTEHKVQEELHQILTQERKKIYEIAYAKE